MYILYNKRLNLLIQVPFFFTMCTLIGGEIPNFQVAKTYR